MKMFFLVFDSERCKVSEAQIKNDAVFFNFDSKK